MTRSYSLIANNITLVSAGVSLASLRPTATIPIEIFEVRIGFDANATSAQQRVQLITQVVSGPPVMGNGVAPKPLDHNEQASSIVAGTAQAAGTSGVRATTESGGATTILVADAFNHLTGWVWVAPPDGGIFLPANFASAFNVFFPDAPGTTTGWQCTVSFKEL